MQARKTVNHSNGFYSGQQGSNQRQTIKHGQTKIQGYQRSYFQPSFYEKIQNYDELRELSDKSEEKQASTMQDSYFQEMQNIVQYMMNQNNLIMERLSHQNIFLMKHLQNMKKIFKLRKQKDKCQKNNPKNSKTAEQKEFGNIGLKLATKREFGAESTVKLGHMDKIKNQKKRRHRRSRLDQSAIQLEDNSQMVCLPIKGATNYDKYEWVTQQNYVLKFLYDYLKRYIRVTPTEPLNCILKKQILQLYKKWREGQVQSKSTLQDFKIQQIITIEMKALFHCKNSLKEYQGLLFSEQSNQVEEEKGSSRSVPRRQEQFSASEFDENLS